ncbi:hypothetical protein UlMin_005715 [Ulmus minor]
MASAYQKLHFVLIPFMASGHFIPMADMARLLAEHGVTVTFVTTPVNAARIKPVFDRAVQSGLLLQLIQLTVPLHEFGMPKGCEDLDLVPSRDLFNNFSAAISTLKEPVEQLLKEMKPSPSCIISDKQHVWLADIARRLDIPRVSFDGTSCFCLLCNNNIGKSKVHESVPESKPFVVPDLPDKIEFTIDQLPSDFNPSSKEFRDFNKKRREFEEEAYGVIVNSFEELESGYVKGYHKAKGENMWCIGPVSLSNKTELDKAQRGNVAAIDGKHCMKWLDSWPKNSVVYASLGTLARLPPEQLMELGLALEESNRPFIWVLKGNRTEEVEKWIKESGFEERTKTRGLTIQGWAPQVLILSHPSIGSFLTHSGWNSTLEAICAGIPMIAWPIFTDQFYNEKLIVQVLRIGESVGAKMVVPLGNEHKFGVMVKKKEVKEAIDKVMVEGKEEEERRNRAKKLAEMAKKAVEEGGSSYLNLKLFIEDIKQLATLNCTKY